jgi:MFS family permease
MNDFPGYDVRVEANYRHNFIVNILDMNSFFLGTAFISSSTILPLFVSHISDNKMWIGLLGVISATGFLLPQLFTANWVQRTPVKRNIVVQVGFFTERVPIFILPMSALLAPLYPFLALTIFFLLYAWHNFGAGVTAVAWQDMIAKIIPLDRRGIFMGLGTFGGTAAGVVGAIIAAKLLYSFAFPMGYAICFALAGLFILISWFFLRLTREVPSERLGELTSNKDYFRNLPAILKRDGNFRWFLISQFIMSLGGMAWGFLAVYASDRWQLSDGFVGTYNTALLIGQSIGNLLFGIIGDRKGYWVVILGGTLAALVALGLSLIIDDPVWYYLVFGLRGLSMGAFFMTLLIVMEFGLAEVRPTYIGIANTALGVAGIFAPLIGGFLAQRAGYEVLFIVSAAVMMLGLLLFVFKVQDPRKGVTHPG